MRTRMLLSPVAAGALMIGCAGGAGLPTDAGSREAAPTDAPMTRHDAMADAKKHDATSGVDGSEGKADSGADAGRGTGIDAGRDAASVKDTGADARADAGRDGGSGKDARTDTGSRDAGRDSSSETDAGARTDGRLDAKASDSGERDAKTLDAAVADAGGACGATCAANQACQNGSCVYVDPASTVTCTFTTSNDTTNPQCGPPCALPAPATITQVNVPVYITEGCTIADEVQSPETYGVVIDAPRIWAAWVAASGAGPGPGASLCLGTWPITPATLSPSPISPRRTARSAGLSSLRATWPVSRSAGACRREMFAEAWTGAAYTSRTAARARRQPFCPAATPTAAAAIQRNLHADGLHVEHLYVQHGLHRKRYDVRSGTESMPREQRRMRPERDLHR